MRDAADAGLLGPGTDNSKIAADVKRYASCTFVPFDSQQSVQASIGSDEHFSVGQEQQEIHRHEIHGQEIHVAPFTLNDIPLAQKSGRKKVAVSREAESWFEFSTDSGKRARLKF